MNEYTLGPWQASEKHGLPHWIAATLSGWTALIYFGPDERDGVTGYHSIIWRDGDETSYQGPSMVRLHEAQHYCQVAIFGMQHKTPQEPNP
jgi:hypothetical protein